MLQTAREASACMAILGRIAAANGPGLVAKLEGRAESLRLSVERLLDVSDLRACGSHVAQGFTEYRVSKHGIMMPLKP